MMKLLPQTRLSLEMALRIVADQILVNVALLMALIARYLWQVGIDGGTVSAQVAFYDYVETYLDTFWVLTAICLSLFILNGIYTRGRFYQHRYKVFRIIQAVSVSYLVFSLFVFFAWDAFSIPRAVLLPAWALTLIFMIGARVFLEVWRAIVWGESREAAASNPTDDRSRNVLVIGGAGYIGSALLPRLLKEGYRVRMLDLLLYGTEPIRDILHHPNLEIIRADFRQVDQMVEAMRGIGAVIHLGAIVGDPACALDEELTIEVNLMATRMIAEVAKGSGVGRFIFASTCSVYGASDELLDEHSSLNPVSLYARSKIASEKVLMQIATDHFAPVILRFGTIYGLSGRTRFDLVVNLLTAKAILDQKITIYGGDQWRPFLHVEDAALAVLTVLQAPTPVVRKQIFNIGSNEQNFTILQVGQMIAQQVPTAELTCTGDDSDRRNYRVDFSHVRRTLGYVPQWRLEGGIRQVIEAIQSGKVTDYQAPEYSNVKFLSITRKRVTELLPHQNSWAQEMLAETSSDIEALVPS